MSAFARLCFLACGITAWCCHVAVVGEEKPPINLIFLGNPGVGKSSLLNQLANKAAFAAGVSIGHGLTTETAVAPSFTYHCREVRLIDTPGLADVAMREKASAQITRGLQQGDDYKMVFVVKNEEGRVVDQDRTTIKLILESIQGVDLRNNYAIIVNKVSAKMMPRLEAEFKNFTTLLMQSLPFSTGQVLLLPMDPRLESENNAILPPNDPLTEKLVEFLDLVPPVNIPAQAAKPIAHGNYDDIHQTMKDETAQVLALMKGMMDSMSSNLAKSEDKHAALMTQLMADQRENANERSQMLMKLMESQRENSEYMERMRSQQAAREAEMRSQQAAREAEMNQRYMQSMEERLNERAERMNDRAEAADARAREWEAQARAGSQLEGTTSGK